MKNIIFLYLSISIVENEICCFPMNSFSLCLLGSLSFFSSADFFQNHFLFSKIYFRNIIRVSNSLVPDHAWRFIRPDLGPDCLQRL